MQPDLQSKNIVIREQGRRRDIGGGLRLRRGGFSGKTGEHRHATAGRDGEAVDTISDIMRASFFANA
jgi:hypothetical protein